MADKTLEQLIQERVAVMASEFQDQSTKKADQVRKDIDSMEPPEPNAAEATLKFKVEIEWRDTAVKLDLPRVAKKYEDISFDVPETYTEIEDISFDVPAVRWVIKKIGPIKTKVPEVYMKRVVIKFSVPKLRKKRVTIKTYVPAVSMERVAIKFKYPKVKLKDVEGMINDYSNRVNERANQAQAEFDRDGALFQANVKAESLRITNDYYSGIMAEVEKSDDDVMSAYEAKIAEYKMSIGQAKANGASDLVGRLEGELKGLVDEAKAQSDRTAQSVQAVVVERDAVVKAMETMEAEPLV
jgi:hypothetical protein